SQRRNLSHFVRGALRLLATGAAAGLGGPGGAPLVGGATARAANAPPAMRLRHRLATVPWRRASGGHFDRRPSRQKKISSERFARQTRANRQFGERGRPRGA